MREIPWGVGSDDFDILVHVAVCRYGRRAVLVVVL